MDSPAKRQSAILPRAKCRRNAEMQCHTIRKSIKYIRVNDLAHLEALAQKLHPSLGIAVWREHWVRCSMMGVQVVRLRVAKFHDRVKAIPCRG